MYGRNARVMYKDTDSIFYHIYTDDLYQDLKLLKDSLDLSEYLKNHFLYDATNKKVPLKMSDELKSAVVKEAVFLKPKAYSIISTLEVVL